MIEILDELAADMLLNGANSKQLKLINEAREKAIQDKFISVETQLPPLNESVLLCYQKGKTAHGNGEVGIFYTQGYLQDHGHEFNYRKGLVYYDYTNRLLQSLEAKTSKNRVISWKCLPKDENQ